MICTAVPWGVCVVYAALRHAPDAALLFVLEKVFVAAKRLPAAFRVKSSDRGCMSGQTQNLPPFTHEVQRWIYEGQNPDPATCGEQKYLLGYQTDKQGLGSTFHVAASFLGNALHVRHPAALTTQL